MQDEFIDRIAEATADKLEERARSKVPTDIDLLTHQKHHRFIDAMLKQHERETARKEQWIRIVGGWGIIAALTAAGIAVWDYIKDHLVK